MDETGAEAPEIRVSLWSLVSESETLGAAKKAEGRGEGEGDGVRLVMVVRLLGAGVAADSADRNGNGLGTALGTATELPCVRSGGQRKCLHLPDTITSRGPPGQFGSCPYIVPARGAGTGREAARVGRRGEPAAGPVCPRLGGCTHFSLHYTIRCQEGKG